MTLCFLKYYCNNTSTFKLVYKLFQCTLLMIHLFLCTEMYPCNCGGYYTVYCVPGCSSHHGKMHWAKTCHLSHVRHHRPANAYLYLYIIIDQLL